jgi:hypothetical protein
MCPAVQLFDKDGPHSRTTRSCVHIGVLKKNKEQKIKINKE